MTNLIRGIKIGIDDVDHAMPGISLSRAVQIDEELQVVDELRDSLRHSPTAGFCRNVQRIVPKSLLKFNSFAFFSRNSIP